MRLRGVGTTVKIGITVLVLLASALSPAIPQRAQAQFSDAINGATNAVNGAVGGSNSAVSGTTPTTGAGSCDSYAKWFSNFHEILAGSIRVDANGSATPPPYVLIPKDDSVGRPSLKFVLALSENQAHAVQESDIFLFFAANTIGGDGSLTPIPGLYLSTDGDGNKNYIFLAPGATADSMTDFATNLYTNTHLNPLGSIPNIPCVSNQNGMSLVSQDSLTNNDQDVKNIFNYIMDVPKDGSADCANGGKYLTGPSSSDGKTVSDIRSAHSGLAGDNPTTLKADCLDESGTGWLAAWHIVNTNNVGGSCGVKEFFGGEIGPAFINLAKCLYTQVFAPIIQSIAGYVGNAAGLSLKNSSFEIAEARCWFT